MTGELHCPEVREAVFEHRRGELDESRRTLLDQHLLDCPACADYISNVDALLEAARDGEGPLSDAAADKLWARLESMLPGEPVAELDALEPPATETESTTAARRAWPRWAFAAAAVIAAAALLWQVWPPASTEPRPPGPSVASDQERVAPEPGEPTKPEVAPGPTAAPVLTGYRPHPAVTVFAPFETRWSFAADDELLLTLETGFVLVEALPEAGQRLVVRTPTRRIEVVGTVFFATADGEGEAVGVAAGTVRVTDARGLTVVLEAGAELDPDGAVVGVRPTSQALVEEHIDLAVHRARLAEQVEPPVEVGVETEPVARRRPREPEGAPVPREVALPTSPAPSVVGPSRSEPLALAEMAQREGRFGDAVAILEALVDARALHDPELGLARLELARLYEARLNQPARAFRHLQRFVTEYPSDPAAPSVLRELCRLGTELGERDLRCGP